MNKYEISYILAKIVKNLVRMINHTDGSSFSGKVLLAFNKNFLSQSKDFAKGIITITGTNGKTTTTGLLASILREKYSVIHNEKGANMLNGIASAIADGMDIRNSSNIFDFFTLECDEAYLTKLYDKFIPDYLCVTNLLRDQLDRYGEIDITRKKIYEAIEKDKDGKLKLLLNADDPMVSILSKGSKQGNVVFFGFSEIEYCYDIEKISSSPLDIVNCSCGTQFEYIKTFYSHLGHYKCPNCKNCRVLPKYQAYAKIFSNYTELIINSQLKFKSSLTGVYNAYNLLSAISISLELGIDSNLIQKGLDHYRSIFGRNEKKIIRNKEVTINLIKNPTGASEVLRDFMSRCDNTDLMIVLNDNFADGRDVSWIWDCDFELLNNFSGQIIVSGTRAYDMALRLKYTNLDTNSIIIEPNIHFALQKALSSSKPYLTILPTYTALLFLSKKI